MKVIFRESDWFDLDSGEPVYSIQAANAQHWPRKWMHVIERGEIKKFGNAGARASWLKHKDTTK